jgi:hypothetical protein
MWLLSRPLCGFVGVERANPGSQACPAVIPDLVVSVRSAGLLGVVVIGAVVLGRAWLAMDRGDGRDRYDRDIDGALGADATSASAMRQLAIGALAVTLGLFGAALLPDTALFTLNGIPVEPIALVVGLPLVYLAGQVIAARDARRFVVGLLAAAVAWFVVFYPNIAALPLPSTIVNAYQGLLPTYLYAFQFPVSQTTRNVDAPLLSPMLAILTIAIGVTCLVVAYSASVWRLALAESRAAAGSATSGDGADGLARTGGGA